MKYNSGDKFIIEINSEYCEHDKLCGFKTDRHLYRIKGFNSLVFDEFGLKKLKKYQEPNANQAYNKAYEDGYDKGLKDAFDAAYKLVAPENDGGLPAKILRVLFDETCGIVTYGIVSRIIKKYSANEIIKIIEAYESPFSIGDELDAHGLKFFLTELGENTVSGIDEDGSVYRYGREECEKTGRHNDAIVAALKGLHDSERIDSSKE